MDFTFTTTNGAMPVPVANDIVAYLKKYDGKKVVVTIKRWVKPRSTQQNRYYFGVVVKAVTEAFLDAGNVVDEEEVHHFLKRHVGKLKRSIVLPDGSVEYTLGSTKHLSTQRFNDYLTACTVWCHQCGIDVPPPNNI